MSAAAIVRHIDLRRPEPQVPDADLVLDFFWWGSLPLGSRTHIAAELPLGAGQIQALAADLLGNQLAGRDPLLGAPLIAGSDARPHQALDLRRATSLTGLDACLERLVVDETCDAGDVSLVICTRDRPQALERCLASLKDQQSGPGELVVVDNSQDGSARPICAGFPNVIAVHEPRPGLSRARNSGIRATSKSIIAFTDDDVVPHYRWLSEIVRTFRDHDVLCVTGLVLPATLETRAQREFQFTLGAFGSSFIPLLFDERFLAETRALGPQVWRIGAGANMAFRRSAFELAGVFDERLGAGASGCSEDSELWYRLLALGGNCLYEPRAVVFHHHRSTWRELMGQVRVYMRGHVSALIAQADAFGDQSNLMRIFKQLPRYLLRAALAALIKGRWRRMALLTAEVHGWLAGLGYFVRPKWRRGRGEWPKL